jgi:hypothetical protein
MQRLRDTAGNVSEAAQRVGMAGPGSAHSSRGTGLTPMTSSPGSAG